MPKIEFPKPLKQLLEDSDLQASIRGLADRVGEILADNKLPFFPDYTDHGIDHTNCVLKSEVELVPKQIWEDSTKDSDPRLLCDTDAAVIIGATLLHDVAMHLRPDGFRELVRENSRFRPLSWFKESHEGHSADRPWQDLWDDYVREARRFSDRQLTDIIGEASARTWKFHSLPEDAGQWKRNHCLVIGEFIRRHHARLAHEIAIHGFPGLPVGPGENQFPAMGEEKERPLMRLADLIGLTARSHGMSLRVCKAYLDSSPHYSGTLRPMGALVFYAMALLRVADYFQIDRQRAPAVLLQLRNPQSPVSVHEWEKHRAVQNIGPASDPRGKMVTVSTDMNLSLYLQLRDLLAGLQAEMDHCTAVLDEVYGARTELGLDQLDLATRRVVSNLQSPAFRNNLPYVANWTGFSADPNLLTLLVEPLYGKVPEVGVRELIQNAVDAVCELKEWCKAREKSVQSLDLPEQDGDVLVEFIKRKAGSWHLSVCDRGIGMTSDTIQDYFLRAGACFRHSPEWTKEFLDKEGQPRVVRAGRFGIGVFAVFLLGPSFRLRTRHAGADKSMGYTLEASANSQLIEIRRVDGLRIGTTIEVAMSVEAVKALDLENKKYSDLGGLQHKIDWFCWEWPRVIQRVVRESRPTPIRPRYAAPVHENKLPAEWSVIHPEGFDAVYWTFDEDQAPTLVCNGLEIADPRGGVRREDTKFHWPTETQLRCPHISVVDRAANLPLTIQRYGLLTQHLPFISVLTYDVTLSFIAHALVCGPASHAQAPSLQRGHPLKPEPPSHLRVHVYESPFSDASLRWCMTSTAMVPADAWLYSLLNAESCLVYGVWSPAVRHGADWLAAAEAAAAKAVAPGPAILAWHGTIPSENRGGFMRTLSPLLWELGSEETPVRDEDTYKEVAGAFARALAGLGGKGVEALGHQVKASRVLLSAGRNSDISGRQRRRLLRFGDVKSESETWSRVDRPNSSRYWFEFKSGPLAPRAPLEAILNAMETSLFGVGISEAFWGHPCFLYVSEIESKRAKQSPESMIARVWNEYLGAKAIPFDPAAREALIADGCKHHDLKRHIEAWQEMKRTGSKWVTGK